ncbi:MAG: tail fiber domain-containing protein [Patescibacteria group bacterium]
MGDSSIYESDNNIGIGGTAPATSPSLYVGADGNVGIGTTSPGYKLDIYDNTPKIQLYDSDSNNYLQISGQLNEGASGLSLTEPFIKGNAGGTEGFGIGYGSANRDSVSAGLAIGTYNGNRAISFHIPAGSFPGGIIGGFNFLTGGTNPTNGISRLLITNDGNVGIGTTDPSSLLSIGSGSEFQVDSSGDIVSINNVSYAWPSSHTADGFLQDDGSGNLAWTTIAGAGGVTGSGTPGYLPKWNTSSDLDDSVIFESSGNIGIGTSSVGTYKLNVDGTGYFSGALSLGTQASSTTHAVRADRSLTAGSGLTGGGDLTADRTFNVGAGNGISVNADDVAVNQGYNFAWTGTQSWADTATFNSDLFFGGSTGILSSGGNVGIGTTSPAFKLQIAGSGDLLSIGDTAGNTFFSVTDSLITSNLPHTFTSSGDVSMAYDLIFTNQTSSYIKSYAPLYIEAGEPHESNDLTLKTYNAGDIILDSASGNLYADGTNVGIGTTDPSYTLDVAGDIGIASGSDLYLGGVGLGGTGGASLVGFDNDGLSYVTSSTVQGGIADLDGAISSVSGEIRWTMDGDSGTPQIVGAGQTASWVGGTGISTTVGADRQLTITNTAPWTDSSGSYIQNQFASAQTGNFWIDGAGLVGTRLGVGATDPSYSLYTTGNLGVGATAYFADRVGIGTTDPGSPLEVVGDVLATSFSIGSSTLGSTEFGYLEGQDQSVFTTSAVTFDDVSITTPSNIYNLSHDSFADYVANEHIDWTGASSNFSTSGSGYFGGSLNLGTGVTTPAFTMVTGAGSNKVFTSDGSGNASWEDLGTVGGVTGSGTEHYLPIWLSGGSSLGDSSIYESDNNIGIGGTAPATSPSLYVGADGNVGVGTTDPSDLFTVGGTSTGKFTVSEDGNVVANQIVDDHNAYKISYWGSGLQVRNDFNITWSNNTNFSGTKDVNISRIAPEKLAIGNGSQADSTGTLIAGSVGIGTTDPSQKLHVEEGGIRLGTTSSQYNVLDTVAQGGAASGNLYWGNAQLVDSTNISDFGVSSLSSPNSTLSLSDSSGDIDIDINLGNDNTWTGLQTFNSLAIADTDIALTGASTNLSSTGDVSFNDDQLFIQQADGNVGIGTGSPGYELDVNGTINASTRYRIGDQSAIYLSGTKMAFGTTSSYDTSLYAGGVDRLFIQASSGNVGIGTTTPAQLLDLAGNLQFSGALMPSGNAGVSNYVLTSTGTDSAPSWTDPTTLGTNYWTLSGSNLFANETSYNVGIGTTTPGTSKLAVMGGNVGIGTTSPGSALSVVGAIRSSGLSAGGIVRASATTGELEIATTGTDYEVPLTFTSGLTRTSNTVRLGGALTQSTDIPLSGHDLTFSGATGNVGIGTTEPQVRLQVNNDDNAISGTNVAMDNVAISTRILSDAVGQATGLKFTVSGSTAAKGGAAIIHERTGSWSQGKLHFATKSSTTNDENIPIRMTIDQTGSVGIGTTTPAAMFSVGSTSQFRVDSAGDLTRIRNVEYSWPSSQGAASTVLTNDGSGNLSWSAVPGDDWGSQVVVSDSTLTGDGTSGSPLGIDLNNANTWTASQTFSANTYFPGSGIWDTSGNVGIGQTSPTFKLQIAGSGDLLSIGDTAGNTFFSVTDSLITSNLPHTFTSSGDVSMAYDLIFTNQTSAKIESYGPFSIIAGESHESNNLTLKTYNAGKLIVDSANFWVDSANVGIGTTDPAYTLDVNGDIGIASGSDLYLGGIGLGGTGGAGLVGFDNAGLSYVTSSTVQGGIEDLDGAISSVSGEIRWTMDGDSGTPQIVGAGQTASWVGGTGISTTVGADRQLTIDFDTTWGDGRYIQDQFSSAQDADFWIDGVGLVGTRLGVGATHPSYSLYTTGNLGVGGTAYFAGNVGVGTTSPWNFLDVSTGSSTNTTGVIVGATSGSSTNNDATLIGFRLRNTNNGFMNSSNLYDAGIAGIVNGTGVNRSALAFYTRQSSAAVVERMRIDYLGSVGIGTTDPAALLSVGATSQFRVDSSGDITRIKNLAYSWPSSHTADGFLQDDGSGNLAWTTIAGAGGVTGTGTQNYLPIWLSGGSSLGDSSIYESGNNVGIGGTAPSTSPSLYVGADGNVGIGTTGPGAKLHVQYPSSGDIIFDAGTGDGASDMNIQYGYNGYGWYWKYLGSGSGDNNELQLWSEGAGSTDQQAYGIKQSGKMTFYQDATFNGDILMTDDDYIGISGAERIQFDTAGHIEMMGANVGIGTTEPLTKLDIRDTSPKIHLYDSTAQTQTNYLLGSIVASNAYTPSIDRTAASIDFYSNASQWFKGEIVFKTNNSDSTANAAVERVRINAAGNVGIGTSSPSGALQVVDDEVRIGSGGTINYATGDGDLYVQDDLEVDGIIYGTIEGSFTPSGDLDMNEHIITNIGNTGTDFTSGGGLTLAGDLTVSGGDIALGTTNIFSGGDTTSLNNIDAINATTESTLEGALDLTGRITGTLNSNSFTVSTDWGDVSTDASGNVQIDSNVVGATEVADDSLDFAQFADSMSLDNLTKIDLSSYDFGFYGTGNVGIGTTTPSYKLDIAGTGTLFRIASGGTDLFTVTDSLITSNLPHTFTSSGDVSMAYNLLFTNPAASYVRSSAPLYIEAGETYGSSNLTLRTYNTGDIILESANLWADGSSVGIGTTDPSQELHVNGDIRVTGGYYDSENSIGSNGDVLTSTGVGTTWSSVSDLSVGNADTLDTLDSTDFLRATASDTFEAGNTLTINGALDVNGAVTLGDGGDDISINSDDWDISSAGVGSGFTQFNVDNLRLDGNTLSATNASGLYLYDDGSNGIFIEDGGNVGVGTTGPNSSLHVNGMITTNSGFGLSFANYHKIYEKSYSVRTSDPATLVDENGSPFDVNKSYRVRGVVTSTGTQTGAVAYFYGNGSSFSIYKNYESGNTSNHIEFYLDSGTPKVRLFDHTSFYNVSVLTEEVINKGRIAGPEMFIYAYGGGNVGIGTTNPGSYKLNVAGNTYIDGALTTTGAITAPTSTNTINNLVINSGTITSGTWQATAIAPTYGGTGDNTSSTTGVPYITAGNWQYESTLDETRGGTGLSSYSTGDLLYASGTDTLGNLGIGTTGQILTVSGGVPVWADSSGLGTDDQTLAEVLTEGNTTSGNNIVMSTTDELRFYDDDTDQRIYASADGTLNIASTNLAIDTSSWDISTAGVGSGFTQFNVDNLRLDGNTLSATNASGLYLYDDGSNGIFIEDGGNVGIGTTDPGAKLEVAGNLKADKFVDTAGGGAYYLDPAHGTISLLTAGNAGIGTVSADYRLDVRSGTTDNVAKFSSSDDLGQILIADNDTTTYLGAKDSRAFLGSSSGLSSNNLVINSDGNVGIGTTDPSYDLHVAGDSYANRFLAPNGTPSNPVYSFFASPTTGIFRGFAINEIGFSNSGSTSMLINADGNVGIGTTDPDYNLEVSGTLGIGSTAYFGSFVGLGVASPNTTLHVKDTQDYQLLLQNNDNTTGDTAGLLFKVATLDTANAKGGILFERTGSYGRGSIHFVANNDAANSDADLDDKAMTIYADGNVGVGTTSVNSPFGVYGQIASFSHPTATSGNVVSIQAGTGTGASANRIRYGGSGNNSHNFDIQGPGDTFLIYGSTYDSTIYRAGYSSSWNTPSDQRIKTEINTLSGALEKITQLNPVTFKWKDDYRNSINTNLKDINYGFIAQEVQRVMPHMVTIKDSLSYGDTTIEDFLNLDTSDLTPYIVKAIQEQQSQINNISQKVTLLNNDLSVTNSGDLNIEIVGDDYQVHNTSTNKIVNRIGSFGETVIAKARVGLIETTSLIADTVTTRRVKSEKLLSPIIETEEIRLKAQNSKLKTTTQNSKLSIVNSANEPTAEFDTETKTTTLFGDLIIERGLKSATSEFEKTKSKQATFGDLLAQNVGIGQLEAESVKTEELDVAQDATIAGTLYVDRVVARDGGFGELLAKDISMDSLRSIVREEMEKNTENTNNISTEDTNVSTNDTENTDSGSESGMTETSESEMTDEEMDIESLLAEVEGWLNLNTDSDLVVGEETAIPENQINAIADNFIHQGDLTILGQTTANNALITGQLIIGDLTLADNSISNLNGNLYLQKEGLGGLDVLNGKFMIDTEGNVFIAQHLTVSGDLMAGKIKPKEGEDLVLDLINSVGQGEDDNEDTNGDTNQTNDEENDTEDTNINTNNAENTLEETGFGKLLVKGANQETVAQIDASGSAQFAGTVRADSLAISKPENSQEDIVIAASENFDQVNIWAPGITSNASAGQASLPVGQTDLIIYNNRLVDESMVYLTPTSDTQNQVLYVKAKVAKKNTEDTNGNTNDTNSNTNIDTNDTNNDKSYFVVGINQSINEEVKFNWWIIN